MNSQERTEFKQEVFEINGNRIIVNSNTLRPATQAQEEANGQEKRHIVFVPGWGVEPRSRSAVTIGQSFADVFHQPVTIFDTFAARVDSRTIAEESAAMAKSIKNSGHNDVTLVGYSEGGIKTADLSNTLSGTNTRIRGLVLMSPAGLYRQYESSLIGKFFKIGRQGASQARESGVNQRESTFQGFISTKELALSITKEATSSRTSYPNRLRSQLRTIANKYPGYKKIATPIILIQGVNDLLSNPELTLPGYKSIGWREREKILRETIFRDSPHIRMIVGEKSGIHIMPNLRSRQVARAAKRMLKVYDQEQDKLLD